jgi:hypothetical protein
MKDQRFDGVTHEGGKAANLKDAQVLRKLVLTSMLFEDSFYVDGATVAGQIEEIASRSSAEVLSALATDARTKYKLRHIPMLLCRILQSRGELRPEVLSSILRRADEPAEFLALLWEKGKTPVPAATKKGISLALTHYDEYQMAKWGRKPPITLRDVIRLCHPKPKDEEQAALWKKVVDGTLETPDTWEVALSAVGSDATAKKTEWLRLLETQMLGGLALLRNLRNMTQVGVPKSAVAKAMETANFSRVLPYRFLAAARYAPSWEDIIDKAMLGFKPERTLSGRTVILVDCSGSMSAPISAKSDLSRLDAACGVAIVAREMCEEVDVFTFSGDLQRVPPRRGMALRDAIGPTRGATYLGSALKGVKAAVPQADRIIVITDEQAHDTPGMPIYKLGYIVNVAPYRKGVGYGPWVRCDGFSEAVLDFIVELESSDLA